MKNYINAELDKTEMLTNFQNRTLSTEIEYYQEIWNIYLKKQQKLKAFQNIVTIFKINYIDFSFFVFICRASRICSRCLLISCAIKVVFSTRNFRNLDLGTEWVLRCKAMEQESLRYIVSRLERVVVVRPTYGSFSLATQSPKGHMNIYTTFFPSRSSVKGEELLEIIRLKFYDPHGNIFIQKDLILYLFGIYG